MAPSPKVEFQCQFCAKVFTRSLRSAYAEITCPKCGETDVLPTEVFGKQTRESLDTMYKEMFN